MENSNEKFDIQNCYVNMSAVTQDKNSPAFIRLLAVDLIQNPYKSVGDFLKELNDSDLELLMNLVEEPEDMSTQNILLLAMMLATAEGLEFAKDEKQVQMRMAQLTSFIVVESLYRKGLIKAYHENMTFDESDNRIIAERL
jgi:predicted DNA-binding transcriptional regulator